MNPDPFNRPAILWVPVYVDHPPSVWESREEKINAACDFWELQLMGIKG